MSSDDLLFSQLIRKLISMARDETELLEFKSNIYDEEKLGKTVSVDNLEDRALAVPPIATFNL